MKLEYIFITSLILIPYVCMENKNSDELEMQTGEFIIKIVTNNLKFNGWNNLLFMGNIPDSIYQGLKLKNLSMTFATTDTKTNEIDIEYVVPYHSNVIIMVCTDFEDFENALRKLISLSYWHPLANIILYYKAPYNKDTIAKIFFIYWYFRAPNVIIVQNDEISLKINHYSPYISENYKLKNLYTCQKTKKVGMPIGVFNKSFTCSKECNNVTTYYTTVKAEHLGTCIGFNTKTLFFKDFDNFEYFNLFEDKGKDLHGYRLFAYGVVVLPFLNIEEHENGTYTLLERDGIIWNTMAELLNFKIDLSPSVEALKKPFDFEINILQVFDFSHRKADLILYPLYQFDLVIAEIDYTVPFTDSGVCILSKRAGFETIVFDVNLLEKNIYIIIEFFICFICTWFVFFIYNIEHIGYLNYDQAGKDLINTFRTILSISLYNPPKRGSFRIFMTISIWSFFIINFSTQAAIISLFSVHKRVKEVDTFRDIIKKGYNIEGMASPDVVLPDDEEEFNIITSKIVTVHDIFGCVKQMPNDSRRFCLIDCAVGRYLVRNMLNDKGEQFLHLVSEARIHSHYLNMIFHKDSPLTKHYNKYMASLFEAGLVKKWMDYRYFDRSDEDVIKALGMEDLGGIFECYCFFLGISIIVFLGEIVFSVLKWIRHTFQMIVEKVKNKIINRELHQTSQLCKHDISIQTV